MSNARESLGGPSLSATLVDSFPDPNSDGRASAGEEVTYTATITNNGSTAATGVTYNTQVDNNSTLVANSVSVSPDLSVGAIRCEFTRGSGVSGSCTPLSAYSSTNSANYTIIGGDTSLLTLSSSNLAYNPGTGIFSFDAAMQNLTTQIFGTIDGINPDAAGVSLFMHGSRVLSGSGSITPANPDGTGTFTSPGQPFFQYGQLNSAATTTENLQFNVPSTVSSFRVDFFVYTKAQAKLVINEVLANPGGTILDANGEWFEMTNIGRFPVELNNFWVGDSAASGDRPPHLIQPAGGSLVIQPNAFRVFGNTTNTTLNGGVPLDYAYGNTLQLANSLDAVRILSPVFIDAPLPFDRIFYEIDRASYNSPGTSAQDGISRELKDPTLDNSNIDGPNWQSASENTVYGPGGRGTPGAANTGAPTPRSTKNAIVPESGETINQSVGVISPGGTAVVTYKVTVANPIPTGYFILSTQATISGNNFATITSDDPAGAGANDATITPIGLVAPSAADVMISGRVLRADGRAIGNAVLTIDGTNGSRTSVVTNPFGYYSFTGIDAGRTYVISTRHRSFYFETRIVTVGDDITDLNIIAIE